MNIQNMLKNWKTTSAGLTMIIGSVVHLIFAIRGHIATEGVWTATFVAVCSGAGLLFAGDASKSKDDHDQLAQQVQATQKAVVSGDTSIITRTQTETPKP